MNKLITEKQKGTLCRAGYTEAELNGLSVRQASNLLYYLSRNDWKRPTQAQIEAIASDELNADYEACKKGVPLARIPSWEEREELTKSMYPADAYAFEEAMSDLKYAVNQQEPESLLQQGTALCLLKQACSHKEWDKVLAAIGLPRITAHRQIQCAKAHAVDNPELRKILEKCGVRFDSCKDLQEAPSVDKASVARDVASLVIELLQEIPTEARREVWRQAGQQVEAEDVLPETQEMSHVAALS